MNMNEIVPQDDRFKEKISYLVNLFREAKEGGDQHEMDKIKLVTKALILKQIKDMRDGQNQGAAFEGKTWKDSGKKKTDFKKERKVKSQNQE